MQAKPRLGADGEDTYKDAEGVEHPKLPSRFTVTTVKGAAWIVLEHSGPQGLSIQEIARRIQASGLRDLRTSKTPEVWRCVPTCPALCVLRQCEIWHAAEGA